MGRVRGECEEGGGKQVARTSCPCIGAKTCLIIADVEALGAHQVSHPALGRLQRSLLLTTATCLTPFVKLGPEK